MKIDITTGDVISPKEIEYAYPSLLNGNTISILAYPLETILAEKYQTIMQRNVDNTRMRDFYDFHVLYSLYKDRINMETVKEAVLKTVEHRESTHIFEDRETILQALTSEVLQSLWGRYQRNNIYAQGLSYLEILKTITAFSQSLQE